MGAVAITIQPVPNSLRKITDAQGNLDLGFLRFLMQWANSFQLITCDTSAGSVALPLPLAASLPNQEIFAIKTSSDGNTFSLTAQGSDLINKLGAWGASSLTVGTAQGAVARLKSDGNSNFYVF
jgi:hypothetical protein